MLWPFAEAVIMLHFLAVTLYGWGSNGVESIVQGYIQLTRLREIRRTQQFQTSSHHTSVAAGQRSQAEAFNKPLMKLVRTAHLEHKC